MECQNCGHGRHLHRATPNALSKARRSGQRRRPQAGCRWMATRPGDRKLCPCRQWKAEVPR